VTKTHKSSPDKMDEESAEELQKVWVQSQLLKSGKKSILRTRDEDETIEDSEKWSTVKELFGAFGNKPEGQVMDFISRISKSLGKLKI
jgi:hypothetical protein